ncbi:MAG: patatin-like phospholipase family protein [Chloroflexi bacterium]|nr:patatin-like phospholipase family protein [Chloroflexota bacterium]
MDITLALGGGGSKGNAHIGVLRVLEREGFRVRAIAGTSAGGLVAAAYAAGFTPDEIEAHMLEVNQHKLYGMLPRAEPALLSLDGIEHAISTLIGERTFNDLQIPCAFTAVDIRSSKEVILRDGRVIDALLATIAVPGIFPPKLWNDHLLVDGGVLDPVPVTLARLLAPKPPVVAVSLMPPRRDWEKYPVGKMISQPSVLKPVSRLRMAQALDIFLHSVEISERMLTALRLEIDKPDAIICPPVHDIGVFDRIDISDVVKRGEQGAELALPALRAMDRWQRKLTRLFRPSNFQRFA